MNENALRIFRHLFVQILQVTHLILNSQFYKHINIYLINNQIYMIWTLLTSIYSVHIYMCLNTQTCIITHLSVPMHTNMYLYT